MATSWFSCKPCSGSDPTQDTVKVDPNLLNKENVQPLQFVKQSEEQRQREAQEEAARHQKEVAAAAAAAEEARLHNEAQRAAAERARQEGAARLEAEEAARHEAVQRAAVDRARKEEAARAAAAAAAAAAQEEERQLQKAARAADEQARLKRKEAEQKVNSWCQSHGFENMNTQKKTLRGATKFPMHTAVKYNNHDIIQMMLVAGVRKDVNDSMKQTPRQLAAKLNKNGSHDHILAILR